MNCPLCNKPLTEIKGDYGHGFECRNDYFYLEKDYPICHYTYRFYKNYKVDNEEYRYLLYPFVVYSYPDTQHSNLIVLYKEGDMSHHGMLDLATLPLTTPTPDNFNHLIEKFTTYLIFQ